LLCTCLVLLAHPSVAAGLHDAFVAAAAAAADSFLHVYLRPGEALERERFQSEVVASFAAGRQFGAAKATFEATNRMAIHLSLLMLYAWGGYLVSQGMMPVGVLVSGIGFTFSLMYATQGAVNTLSELRRAAGAFDRVSDGCWVVTGWT
jgi:ATP-binding cassette subfamily B (MDR/TAP) protein 8